MSAFKLSDPYGTAPSQAPFKQSVSTGTPWHNLPITREYTLGQLLDQTFTEADVAAFCKDRISWFKIPKYVHFLDEFPMTASQKIQKYKLRDQAHELWPEA